MNSWKSEDGKLDRLVAVSQDRWKQAQAAEAEYWADTAGSVYQSLHELTEHYQQAAGRVAEMLAGRSGLEAIEIGIGPMGIGFLQVYAAANCSRIVGVEPLEIGPLAMEDPALVEYLRALRARAEVLRIRAENLPMAPASFDLACCINVLDHTGQPWAVTAELARVVRQGGLLVLAVHTRSSLGRCKWQIDRRLHRQNLFYRAHPHAFLWRQVDARLRKDWDVQWCDRPGLRDRLLGHQVMSTWILKRR